MDTLALYSVMLTNYPDVLEVSHLCEILGGVGKGTVYTLIRSGDIESMKVGKKYLIPKINILKYLRIVSK